MSALFAQLGSLLTSAPGSLIYQLVLAFSIAASLQLTWTGWRASGAPQDRRAFVGLGAMLLVLIGHSILGFIAAGSMALSSALPAFDRAVTCILLAVGMWLWNFPAPSRIADISTVAISVIAALAGAVTAFLSATGIGAQGFNRTVLDTLWQVSTIGLLVLGAAFLYIRRAEGFGYGLAFAALALLGHLVHLVLRPAGDYSGVIRLAHMAAFPLLLTLPQRVKDGAISGNAHARFEPGQGGETKRYAADPRAVHALLALATDTDAGHVVKSAAKAVARTMLADVCLIVQAAEDSNHLSVTGGYDLIREDYIEGSIIENTSMPRLASAIQRNRPLRLPAAGTSDDARALAGLLGLAEAGDLLEAPIMTAGNESLGALVLLSPFSRRAWDNEDQDLLVSIAAALAPVVQRQGTGAGTLSSATEGMRTPAGGEEVLQLRRRNDELAQQLEMLATETERSAAELAELENMREADAASRRKIRELEADLAQAGAGVEPAGDESESQLRETLEDLARLQNQLAAAEQRNAALEVQGGDRRHKEQAEVIASISQELRQPMSSIIGYTDLLLGESVGILGALQRKFVERIKASTERIGGLIDDMIQLSTLEIGLAELKPEAMDLNLIIDNALAYTSSQVREKKIAIHLDLPRNLAAVNADREALQQILIHLLQNAGAASPMEGSVGLKVMTSIDEGRPYVMIQVTDSGGGIPEDDMPRVFTRLFRADNVLIQGVGDTGVGLSIAKTLTEAQNGRIWVESQAGAGATFSVLIPAVPDTVARLPGREAR